MRTVKNYAKNRPLTKKQLQIMVGVSGTGAIFVIALLLASWWVMLSLIFVLILIVAIGDYEPDGYGDSDWYDAVPPPMHWTCRCHIIWGVSEYDGPHNSIYDLPIYYGDKMTGSSILGIETIIFPEQK